ncbi:two-component response regulator ORR21-like isoform X2 [Macadamia integrifolia]|nr:two-component response regulator ORR21-like isoform X2 [Macadamia integrifolia]XP_042502440.1 two-component response regulator ORR21-like isoform X2 [Macadamia integrifolia]XP_042502441.1 two-component response regulator ORR21-like isoform X2 [Macadamia integrifolia]
MPEMNGLELLDSINAEFKLPVVMMSSDTSKQLAWRCLEQGASYYFVKPLNINSVGKLWQFVFLKKHVEYQCNMGSVQESLWSEEALQKGIECTASVNREIFLFQNKKRMVWTTELHKKFERVVNEIGVNGATPKRILEMMNEPGLEKKHISSHLQKYRLSLKAGEKQQEFDDEPSLSSLDEEDELVNFSSAPSPPVSNTKQGKAECMTYQTSNDSFPVPNFGYPKSFPTSSSGMLKQPLPDLVAYFNQKNYINCSSSQMIPHNVRNEPSFYSDNAIGSVSSLETLKMVHQQSQMTLTTQSSSVSSSSIASANQLPAMSSNIIEEPPSVQSPGHLQNDDKVIEEADDILFNWMNCGSIFEDFDFPDHSVEK